MALIKCPECGKEVSDQAEVCIQCGYPIKQNFKTTNTSNQESIITETIDNDNDHFEHEINGNSDINEDTIVNESSQNESNNNNSHHKYKTATAIILIAVAVCILIAVIASLSTKPLPYGIKPDMNIGQMRRQLEDNGFAFDFIPSNNWGVFFKANRIFGVRAYSTHLWTVDENFYIHHSFGKLDKQGTEFSKLLEELKKEYGEPKKDYRGNYWQWGKLEVVLYEFDDGDVTLEYNYRET